MIASLEITFTPGKTQLHKCIWSGMYINFYRTNQTFFSRGRIASEKVSKAATDVFLYQVAVNIWLIISNIHCIQDFACKLNNLREKIRNNMV